MKLDLMTIKKGETSKLDLDFMVHLNSINYYGDIIKFVEPVHVLGRIYCIGDRLLLTGEIETKLEIKCSRCLKLFICDFQTNMKMELIREGSSEDAEFLEDAYFYNSNILDMDEIVNEVVLTNIPMKGLCNKECQGLCSHCGKDLNQEVCDCNSNDHMESDDLDPRLAKLKKLLQED